MQYLTYGEKNNPTILLLHGMATTATISFESLLPYMKNYYVVLAQIDGHVPGDEGVFTTIKAACDDIEAYVDRELDGKLYCLYGQSLGGTMAVELAGRGHIQIEKLFLDAAFTVRMGWKTPIFRTIFWGAIHWLSQGRKVPQFVIDKIMGKGNTAVVQMLYRDVKKATIINACNDVYRYQIPDGLKDYKGAALFVYGTNEHFPPISAAIVKNYIPQMEIQAIPDTGHCQYMWEEPEGYWKLMEEFL